MEPHHDHALNEALTWINQNYSAYGIIVSGTIIRGNPNQNSDFDIYVIHSENFRQRVQKKFGGVPCEILINTIEHTLQYFEDELAKNRPVTAHIISTGTVYKGIENTVVQNLISRAKEYVSKAPVKTKQQILIIRYTIANLFEDVNDLMPYDEATALYILNKLMNEIIDFVFLTHATPLPRIKERLLKMKQIAFAESDLIHQFYLAKNTKEKHQIATSLMALIICNEGFFEWSSIPE